MMQKVGYGTMFTIDIQSNSAQRVKSPKQHGLSDTEGGGGGYNVNRKVWQWPDMKAYLRPLA